MNELKMGFKHSMMQRLQHYEMYPTKPAAVQANSSPSAMTTPPNGSLVATPQQRPPVSAGGQVTDFSIQRILSEPKPSKVLRKSPPRLTSTPKTPPSPFILDLSKSAPAKPSPEASTLSASSGQANGLAYPPNYYGLHPDFLAMAAAANATKFYAQFFPQIFPAYNQPPATYSPKRYFAPYVINSNGSVHHATTRPSPVPPAPSQHANLHAPSPLKISTNELSPTVASGSPGKLACPRADCVDCLDYYKQFNYKNQRFSSSSPLSACTTSSGYSSVRTKSSSTEILMNSSTISLTTVSSLNISSKSSELMAKSLTAEMAVGPKLNLNAEEISYKCRICDKVFGCSQTLQAHEKTHKSPRYECADCGKGFSQLRNYKYHLSVHRGTKEFAAECPECGKTFNDKGYLSSHMKIHRNKKEYECPYCPKSFNQRVAFNMHVRIHTGVKPHKCTECGKRFSRKMLLKQHMRTHSGEKPYQCSVCGKSFADRSNMTLHHRLHSGIKPFSCPICPKAFTKKHHLKTHLNYHTGCKPYVCPHPNCNQAFTQSSNMRTHAKKCQFRPLHLQFPVVSSSACPMTNTMSAMPPPPPQPVTATVDLTRMPLASASPGIRMLTAHSATASVLARTATTFSTTTPTVFPTTVATATTTTMPQSLLAMRPFTL